MRKLISISVVLNVALVLAVGYGWKQKSSIPKVVVEEEAKPLAQKRVAKNVRSTSTSVVAENKGVDAAKVTFNWREVESADYKTYIENLRRVHCPESTIADIIIADVNKFYRNKLAPLRKNNNVTFKFWENDNFWGRRDPAYDKALRETEKEKSKLLKELLGSRYKEEAEKYSEWRVQSESEDTYSKNIPENIKERMAEIMEKYNDMRNEFYRKRHNMSWDEDDQAELRKMERDKTAELAKILSPEELLEFRLRGSETVQQMRWNELDGFNTTEEEFRAIAKTRLDLEDLEGSDKKLSREERTKFAKEAEDNLKKIMGEDRYAEFKLNQQWDYRNLKKVVEKNGGDPAIAKQVFEMKDDIQRAVNTVRADKSLTSDERTKKLTAIRDEIDSTLTEALGERGYKSFKRNAWWLRNMIPEVNRPN